MDDVEHGADGDERPPRALRLIRRRQEGQRLRLGLVTVASTGTFEVPNYLTGTAATGSVLNNGDGPGSSPLVGHRAGR